MYLFFCRVCHIFYKGSFAEKSLEEVSFFFSRAFLIVAPGCFFFFFYFLIEYLRNVQSSNRRDNLYTYLQRIV